MTAIIIRRLVWLPVLLVAISLTIFLLGTYGPGDPARVRLGNRATPENVARLREEMGLNRPIWEQYGNYLFNVIQGDFGESYVIAPNTPVVDLLAPRIGVSLQISLAVTVVAFLVGIPLGVYAAMNRGNWIDRTMIGLALIPQAVPIFVLIPFVLYVFSFRLKLFPAAGWDGIFSERFVLPLFVMTIGSLAGLLRQMRVSTLDTLYSDYVRTARAKGLSEFNIMRTHVLRNAILPVWTSVAFIIAGLPTGSLIVEQMFGIPGVGQMAYEAVLRRDFPIVQAITLLGAGLYVVGNLVVDLGYPFIDPRIRKHQ